MKDFEYHLPRTLKEAIALLDQFNSGAKVLAGGTDLIPQMKLNRIRPAVLVDIKQIPELNRIDRDENGTLYIGACVPLNAILSFTPVAEGFGILLEGCSLIGSYQLRNRASLGGNICNAAPSADTAPALLCLQAQAVVAGPGGERRIQIDDFFQDPGKTAMAGNELLVGVEIRQTSSLSAGSYLRHTPRKEMDIAVAGVAVHLSFNADKGVCGSARVALGAVGPRPFRAEPAEAVLIGNPLSDHIIERSASLAAEAAEPISDVRGSANYRREIVSVLTKRTLRKVRDQLAQMAVGQEGR